jgi:hypothetical protein
MRQSAVRVFDREGREIIGDFRPPLHADRSVTLRRVNRVRSNLRSRAAHFGAAFMIVIAATSRELPAQAPAASPAPAAAPPLRRPALLREGTMLLLARGRAEPIEGGGWRFVPEIRGTGGLERDFILLPNPVLEDVVRLAGRADVAPGSIEASGEVLTYGGRNWLLLSYASPLGPVATPEPAKPAPTPTSEDEEEIADDLERRLLEAVGNVPASLAPTEAEIAAAGSGRPAPIAHGSLLQSRRGRLVRDTVTGGTRFVFTHQREAIEPASLVVLPCRLLEVAESRLRRTEGNPALVVTGTVVSFAGRNYLRPTAIRFAAEGKGLDP